MKLWMETDRLVIRPFKNEDYRQVTKLCSNYDLHKYTLGIPHPYTQQNAKDFIDYTIKSSQEGKSYELAVAFKDNPENVVACISLVHVKPNLKAELGYWVGKEYWGKGIATEMVNRMMQFGFDDLNLHSIFARHFADNPASGKVMQKCGMKYVGTMREQEYKLDKFHDVLYYDILAKDYKNLNTKEANGWKIWHTRQKGLKL